MAVKADCTARPSRWFLQGGQTQWRVGTSEAMEDCLSAPYAQSASPSGSAAGMPNDAAYGTWRESQGSTVQTSALTVMPVIERNQGGELVLDPCTVAHVPCQNGGVCTATTAASSGGH